MRIQLNTSIDVKQTIKNTLGNKIPYSFKNSRRDYSEAIIAYVCPECGAELYGNWISWQLFTSDCTKTDKAIVKKYEETVRTFLREEFSEVREMKICPVCGGQLSHEKGFYLEVSEHDNFSRNPDGLLFSGLANNKKIGTKEQGFKTFPVYSLADFDYHGTDSLFVFMKQQREEVEKQLSTEKINDKTCLFDLPSTEALAIEKRDNIKSTPEELKKYVHNLIKLEINIYSLTQRLITLYSQENEIMRKGNAMSVAPLYKKRETCMETEELIACFAKLARYEEGQIGIRRPAAPFEPIYKTPSLLNKKKILAENEELQRKYQNELRVYEEQVHFYELETERLVTEAKAEAEFLKNKIKTNKEEIIECKDHSIDSSLASEIKNMLYQEIKEAEALLKKMYECRNKLYAYDIVFGKYRNVVALSTFYEYLLAGRCMTLEGTDGAYNLYENQLRADMIIGQLSRVIERLEEIKDTQYMIYSELQTVNKNLNSLNNTMKAVLSSVQDVEKNIEDISANTKLVAYNTAVTAHYSKLNAELTNALGYMIAFK